MTHILKNNLHQSENIPEIMIISGKKKNKKDYSPSKDFCHPTIAH